ncbi:MAG TPA: hypothetical protein DGD08_10295 [Gemmatimonas aurantiaca]|uniref:Uncharacterized protein n=2 Tax=Gemmatimonas aurantiaca TaxID=173480 RepID=C1A9V2_GEMAT|nr:hypothetical protein [Gemmatimonas aurantiaca]BAH39279.1 hypothetical protein GAU_2237 [Gemmatimonas aurantiaca T-27]HCT57576.1 hypothetical protein [Gemmatimonas aurantiaca]
MTIHFPLYNTTQQALGKFRRYLPAGALPPRETPELEKEEVEEWASALLGVTLEAITDAVSRWLRDEEMIERGRTRVPTIATFARYARQVDRDHHRPPLAMVVDRPSLQDCASRIEQLQLRAEQVLGREHGGRVWGILLDFARTSEEREQIRNGVIAFDRFDEAVAMAKQQVAAEQDAAERQAKMLRALGGAA